MRELKINKFVKDQSGFTLIELLVVIAIIGILAAIVLIGLNPAARINEANAAKAQADVKQGGSLAESCVTKELGSGPNTGTTVYLSCGSPTYLTNSGNSYARTVPATINMSGTGTQVCVWEVAGNTSYWYSTLTGSVQNTKPASC